MQKRVHDYVVADKGTAQQALDQLVKDWTKVFKEEGKRSRPSSIVSSFDAFARSLPVLFARGGLPPPQNAMTGSFIPTPPSTALPRRGRFRVARRVRGLSDRVIAWLFVTPTIALLLAINIFPLIWMIRLPSRAST